MPIPSTNVLFTVHTPYHALLATAIATQIPGEKEILVIGDFTSAPLLTQILAKLPGHLFRQVHSLPGVTGGEGQVKQKWTIRQGARKVMQTLSGAPFSDLFVFNDYRPESQAALVSVLRQNPAAHLHYVEDGLNAYIEERAPQRSQISQWLARAYTGFWWQPVERLGTHPLWQVTWAHRPDLLQPELRQRPTRTIEAAWYQKAAPRALAQEFATQFGAADLLESVIALILLPHSSRIKEPEHLGQAIAASLATLAKTALPEGPVAIKAHVRDSDREVARLQLPSSYQVLPSGLPAEFCYMVAPRLRAVLTPQATSAFSAEFLWLPGGEGRKIVSLPDV